MGNCASPLRQAMRFDDVAKVNVILEEAGEGSPDIINEDFTGDCLFDACQRNRFSPVHTAMARQQLEILELLLKYGGDPNMASRHYGQTVLHQAARQNNLVATKMAIKYGAQVYGQDSMGKYPIHCAAMCWVVKGNIDVLRYLTEYVGKPQDINLKDDSGNTPLHIAAKYENLPAVNYLIEKGADQTEQNDDGKTPGDL